MTDAIHQQIDAALLATRQSAHKAGVKEGRRQVQAESEAMVNRFRADLIAQGRQNGIDESRPLIVAAQEEGRVQGVEDGRTQAQLTLEKRTTDLARKEGKEKGYREGYKAGRGEGYRAGWNDAISTPARDHKAK